MSVIILGSGKSVLEYPKYKKYNFTVVVVNNAWKATDDWNYWIRPGDYKGESPANIGADQKIVTGQEYNLAMRSYGHVTECGFSIMLNASYWVMEALKPKNIYYLGADMNYEPDENGNTHFYGVGFDIKNFGVSDPDRMAMRMKKTRPDYLREIYMRFYNFAQERGIGVYNLSSEKNTRLPYPKIPSMFLD